MPAYPNTTPQWLRPENVSVFDSPATKALRAVGNFFGANNPAATMMGAVGPMAAIESGAMKGLQTGEDWILDAEGRALAPKASNVENIRPPGPWDANTGPLAWSPKMIDTPGGSTLPLKPGMAGTPHPASGLDRSAIEELKAAAMDRFAHATKGMK